MFGKQSVGNAKADNKHCNLKPGGQSTLNIYCILKMYYININGFDMEIIIAIKTDLDSSLVSVFRNI
jgi:hypothetical protein